MLDPECLNFLPLSFHFTSYTDRSSNSSMESKIAIMPARAVKLGPKPHALSEVAEATEKAKVERFLQGMAMFEEEQGKKRASIVAAVTSDSLLSPAAKVSASTVAPYSLPSARGQAPWVYEIPMNISHISNSLKIDDPLTPMRIGHLSSFIVRTDAVSGSVNWVGFTWAEIFFPVLGERPKSVVGSKAYEVVLKQSLKDGGKIVRENVFTTGRVIGVVLAELPHETVSVRMEDWFVKSDVFKKGRWNQLNKVSQTVRAGDGGRAGLTVPHTAVRGGENGENSVRASCAGP